MSIGARIKSTRKQRGMTQKEAASKAGLSQSAWSELETGESNNTYNLVPIAAALGVDPRWLETGRSDTTEAAQLALEITQLDEAQRNAIKALVVSLRGVSVGAQPGVSAGGGFGEISAYERRILEMTRQMSERARSDAEDQLKVILRTNQKFAEPAPEASADLGRRKTP